MNSKINGTVREHTIKEGAKTVRQTLIDRPRQHFTGVIRTYGSDHNGRGVTALTNVEDQAGNTVTDHLWVQNVIHPVPGRPKHSLMRLISAVATPRTYIRHNSQQPDIGLADFGRIFYAVNSPPDLSPQVVAQLNDHPNRYFAGLVSGHQLTFIYMDESGHMTDGLQDVMCFRSMRGLAANVQPYAQSRPFFVFKVIRYRGEIYFGLPARH